jgi:Chromo (CHRromatin Organisation MOdifier) domain
MRSIHPIFHVSMLEPSTPNPFSGREPTLDPPVFIDGEPEYEISEILDSRINKRRKCKLLYLVRWTGYEGTDEETSWLPASELGHADEVVVDFHEAYPAKPGPLSMFGVTH